MKAATRSASMPKAASRTGKPPKAPAKAKAPAKKPAAILSDWRAEALDRMRSLLFEADPDAVEEVKWRKASNNMQGVATWSHDGLICTGETYKDKVKLTFARGAALEDPAGLFNADDRGNTRRAIDIRQGDVVDAAAFKDLVRAAVQENQE